MAPVKVTQGFIDRSREYSATQYWLPEPVGDDLTDDIAAANTVKGAIAVVTLCNFTNQTASLLLDSDVPVIPSSVNAQRELGLWIQYVDTVTGQYQSMTIPGPNLTLLSQANTDEVDIVSNVTAAALLAVLEAELVSDANNPIEVTRMRIIGRRS